MKILNILHSISGIVCCDNAKKYWYIMLGRGEDDSGKTKVVKGAICLSDPCNQKLAAQKTLPYAEPVEPTNWKWLKMILVLVAAGGIVGVVVCRRKQ